MKHRTDFVSNSSSCTFIIDADADRDCLADRTLSFEDYYNAGYLKEDICGSWFLYAFEKINHARAMKFYNADELAERFNKDRIYLCALESDKELVKKLGDVFDEIVEIYEKTQYTKQFDENRALYDKSRALTDEMRNLQKTMVEHVFIAIKDKMTDFKVAELSGEDGLYTYDDSINDEEYISEYVNSCNSKFYRVYNNH